VADHCEAAFALASPVFAHGLSRRRFKYSNFQVESSG
jgi:hypothetical protein